jgi:autotransporter-associated beta strand protein
LNTTNASPGVLDGQGASSTFTIGDLEKNGAGTFNITSSVWGGGTYSTTTNTPAIRLNAGKLRLLSGTSLSDGANLVVTSPGVFDLNDKSETISTISGSGTITSTSTSNILTLTTANTDVTSSTFSGILGSVSITKNGTGTLLLSSDNSTTYTGATIIGNGILQISNAGALGTAASSSTISSTGTLQLVGNALTVSEAITINGEGYNSLGAISNLTGSNTLSGTITLGSSSKISTGTSTGTASDILTITGGINTASSSYNLSALEKPHRSNPSSWAFL